MGTDDPANKECGDLTATRSFIGTNAGRLNTGEETLLWGSNAGEYNTLNNLVAIGQESGQNNTGANVNNIGYRTGRLNSGTSVSNIGFLAGESNSGTAVNNIGESAGRYNTGNFANNLGASCGEYNTGLIATNIGWETGQYNTGFGPIHIGYRAGRNNTGSFTQHNGYEAGLLNTHNYCYTFGREAACTATNQAKFGSTTYPMTMVIDSTASYCVSTDTCQSRGASNRWTGASGVDWYTEAGHFCAGTGCTAMSASNVGIYDSGNRVASTCTISGGTCSINSAGLMTIVPPAAVNTVTSDANFITVTTPSPGTTNLAPSSTFNLPGDLNVATGTAYSSVMRTPQARIVETISYGSTPTLFTTGAGACIAGSAPTIDIDGTGEVLSVGVMTGDTGCGLDTIVAIQLNLLWTDGVCVGSQTFATPNSADQTADISFGVTFADDPILYIRVHQTALKPSTIYTWTVICKGRDLTAKGDGRRLIREPKEPSYWQMFKDFIYNPLKFL